MFYSFGSKHTPLIERRRSMSRLFDLLHKAFRPKNKPTTPLIPEDVAETLKQAKASRLCGYLEWACDQSDAASRIKSITQEVHRLAWPQEELDKLDAYILYYSKQYQRAHERARPFLDHGKFDQEYYGIDSMALFYGGQFDQAYQLLLSIRDHESQLASERDFLIASYLICWSAGDRYRAKTYLDTATRLYPDDATVKFNAVSIYFELGETAAAEKAAVSIQDGQTMSPSMQYSTAFIELAKNNYLDGFRMAECRYDLPEAYRHMRKELLDKPRWHGGDINDKVLLVHGEQGLGDMIMTARYFGMAQDSAKSVLVDCPPESIAFLEHNFPDMTFLPLDERKPIAQPFDLWLGTVSLPYVFGSTCETVPGKSGYLSIPEDHASYWSTRVEEIARSGSARIGVTWSGFPGHRADRRRSIPWKMVRPLIEQHPEIDFFALQIKVPSDLPANLYDVSEEMATLSDTAALINEMDLVITVDTSIVHMAGAVGKRTWMLLPYRYEWRWGLEGEENCWYDSVRVLRQPTPGAWAPILSKAYGRELREFIASNNRKTA